ncbi:MAG: exodeoxyribonuclease VII large subunit [Pseudomonadales bacterium]|nr:exodeoxyribonuclease VII large subunit [Pseudomonadales bacterium]MCP5343005.1 exodeoxyribonuclease VII large subunit [Pseudomonadales bacterium]
MRPMSYFSPSSPVREALSVSSLNRLARSLLEDHFPAVLVEGEISNLAMPASGHWYFTLKDESSQIRCAMFRNRNAATRMRPRDGMQVLLRGKLSIYEGRGDYQLIAETLEEAGDGALRRRFEQLKQKLQDEGLFAPERKRPMPEHVRHIGVITSATGAVIRDMINVLGRRFPAITVTLLPVPVQGIEAAAAICRALAIANRRAAELGLDVLILGRGGGSLEDLQAFNEESVARAIADSRLPVVSAVGHETDFTIADFVADLRAPTPSAAAELLSPDQEETLALLSGYAHLLGKQIRERLQQHSQQLLWLTRQLKHPGRRLQEYAQTLDLLEARLQRATRLRQHNAGRDLRELQQRLWHRSPATAVQRELDALAHYHLRLHRALQQRLHLQRGQLAQLVRSLDGISPLNTLKRGYSISFDSRGQVVRQLDQVQEGESLHTQLADGSIESVVTRLLPGKGLVGKPSEDTTP